MPSNPGILNDVQSLVGSVSTLTGKALPGDWRTRLQQASWRGVPFQTLGGQIRVGRRNAVHEYPFRDTVWVEDLGRSARRITVAGFLVGDDVVAQRERLVAACEAPGDGQLVHMTLGRLTVSLLDTVIEERWDRGRVFDIGFTFIEAGARSFPNNVTSTGDAVMAACTKADAAASSDFLSGVSSSLAQGSAVISQAANTAARWARTALQLGSDATNLMNMVSSLPGTFGRYFGGRNRSFRGVATGVVGASTTVEQLLAIGTVSRNNVVTATNGLIAAVSGLSQ